MKIDITGTLKQKSDGTFRLELTAKTDEINRNLFVKRNVVSGKGQTVNHSFDKIASVDDLKELEKSGLLGVGDFMYGDDKESPELTLDNTMAAEFNEFADGEELIDKVEREAKELAEDWKEEKKKTREISITIT